MKTEKIKRLIIGHYTILDLDKVDNIVPKNHTDTILFIQGIEVGENQPCITNFEGSNRLRQQIMYTALLLTYSLIIASQEPIIATKLKYLYLIQKMMLIQLPLKQLQRWQIHHLFKAQLNQRLYHNLLVMRQLKWYLIHSIKTQQ